MTQNKKYLDDIDYLSQLGFEAVKVSDSEINELNEKVRTKYGSISQLKNYLYALSIGLFIGITLFFAIYNTAVVFPSQKQSTSQNSVLTENKAIVLDTVSITEKIIKTSAVFKDKFIETDELIEEKDIQAESMQPIETNVQATSESNTSTLKYSPNTGFIFLHDLKIANYQVYYFKAQKNITIQIGLPANYSNKEDQQPGVKKLDRTYYLHEAIDDAMALFKKQNYTECLNLLNTINEYNSNDVNCQFYGGMCAFYTKNYSLAYDKLSLAEVNTINVFQEESKYYLAITALQLNKTDEANKMLLDIVNSNGFYSQKAKELLQR